MALLLLLIIAILVVGALPHWPHSSGWGYYPSGGFGLVLVVAIILLVVGRI